MGSMSMPVRMRERGMRAADATEDVLAGVEAERYFEVDVNDKPLDVPPPFLTPPLSKNWFPGKYGTTRFFPSTVSSVAMRAILV